jgi:NADH-quinone oxidoreductase subunit L
MFRLLFLTFFGASRFDERKVHVHESPRSMLVPLVVLAILAVGGGWMAAPQLMGDANYFQKFLAPVLHTPVVYTDTTTTIGFLSGDAAAMLQALLGAPVIAGLLGFILAWWFYIRGPQTPKKRAGSPSAIYELLSGKYFVDELYAAVIVRPLVWISDNILWHVVDEGAIDGTVNGVARASRETGDRLRYASTGNIRSYAAWILVGLVVFTSLLLWMAG